MRFRGAIDVGLESISIGAIPLEGTYRAKWQPKTKSTFRMDLSIAEIGSLNIAEAETKARICNFR
jgi:hypothetical protein